MTNTASISHFRVEGLTFRKSAQSGAYLQVCPPERMDVTFKTPGPYDFTVKRNGQQHTSGTVKVQYVHREARDLTQSEWDDYAHAMLTLKSTPTAEGRVTYGSTCPSGRPEDYHDYEFFVFMHLGFLPNQGWLNPSQQDQIHFGLMMDPHTKHVFTAMSVLYSVLYPR